MDYNLIVSATGVLVTILVSYKSMPKPFIHRKRKLREDYNFAESLITNDRLEKMHDYLLERGYWGLSGTLLDASTIRFFMNKQFPLEMLMDFGRGYSFLRIIRRDKEVTNIVYKPIIAHKSRRTVLNIALTIPYFVCATLAISPAVFLSYFIGNGPKTIGLGLSIMLIFGTLTYLIVSAIWSLHSAKRVIDKLDQYPSEQQNSTASIERSS